MVVCRPRWPRRQRWKMGERSCCVFVRTRWWFHIERRTKRSLEALCGNHAELLVQNGWSRSLTEQCGTLQLATPQWHHLHSGDLAKPVKYQITPLWWWLTQDLSNKHSLTLCSTEKWDRRQRKEMFHLARRVRFKMQVRKTKSCSTLSRSSSRCRCRTFGSTSWKKSSERNHQQQCPEKNTIYQRFVLTLRRQSTTTGNPSEM